MTLKQCHEFLKANADTKVTSEATLDSLVPTLIECIDQVAWAYQTAKSMRELVAKLSEATADYVEKHPACVDEMVTSPVGVRSYDKTIDGRRYHLACGFDGFIREDGQRITQDFLSALPDGWVKSKLELDKTGIKRAGVTGEQLLNAGLVQKPTFVWSETKIY